MKHAKRIDNPTTFENRFTEILIIAKVMKTSCGLGAHSINALASKHVFAIKKTSTLESIGTRSVEFGFPDLNHFYSLKFYSHTPYVDRKKTKNTYFDMFCVNLNTFRF